MVIRANTYICIMLYWLQNIWHSSKHYILITRWELAIFSFYAGENWKGSVTWLRFYSLLMAEPRFKPRQNDFIVFIINFFSVIFSNKKKNWNTILSHHWVYRCQMGPMNLVKIFWVSFLVTFYHKLEEQLFYHFLIYKKGQW